MNALWGKKIIRIWSYWKWLENFSGSQDITIISSSHYSNRKAARHCSVVRFKKSVSPHRIDCPPGEENREGAHERKKNRYETLRADRMEKGWIYHVIPIEVCCRGFLGYSVILFLSKIGITSCSLKVSLYRLQTPVHQIGRGWERKVSAWMRCAQNHLSRVITQHQETVTANA